MLKYHDNENPSGQINDQMTSYYDKNSQYNEKPSQIIKPAAIITQDQNQAYSKKPYNFKPVFSQYPNKRDPSYPTQSTMPKANKEPSKSYAQTNVSTEKSENEYDALLVLINIQKLIKEFIKNRSY